MAKKCYQIWQKVAKVAKKCYQMWQKVAKGVLRGSKLSLGSTTLGDLRVGTLHVRGARLPAEGRQASLSYFLNGLLITYS